MQACAANFPKTNIMQEKKRKLLYFATTLNQALQIAGIAYLNVNNCMLNIDCKHSNAMSRK